MGVLRMLLWVYVSKRCPDALLAKTMISVIVIFLTKSRKQFSNEQTTLFSFSQYYQGNNMPLEIILLQSFDVTSQF